MWLLAADTSGKDGSIALARGNPDGSCEVLEVVPLQGGTFSAQLIPQIISLLNTHKLKKDDIGGFAVASGPGSFTGLRVGLAAIKALAEVLTKPIAAVSRLEVISVAANMRGVVTAALDAGRNEIYVGRYEITDPGSRLLDEKLISRDEFLAGRPTFVTPDRSVADASYADGITAKLIPAPQADWIARLGWSKILAGQTADLEDLDANYIRRSDAEIFSKH